MRFEDNEAMTIQEHENQARQAQQRLQQAFDAYSEGKLDQAEEAFGDAEIHFRLLSDFKRAGDCRSMRLFFRARLISIMVPILLYHR